jgi:hypothetical protein
MNLVFVSSKPLVFVSSPYRSRGNLSTGYHIRVAEEICIKLTIHGVHFLCPHLNSRNFDKLCPEIGDHHWLQMSLRLLKCCDAVFSNLDPNLGGWSEGMVAEHNEAILSHIPIFIDFKSLLKWVSERWTF